MPRLLGMLFVFESVSTRCNISVSSWVNQPLYKRSFEIWQTHNEVPNITCLPVHGFKNYSEAKVCTNILCYDKVHRIVIQAFNDFNVC